MKTLLLVRHAKSSWETGLEDFERPLNNRGKRDAPLMATRLLARHVGIDVFVSSSAERAVSTARFFAGRYGFDADAIQSVPALYHAGPSVIGSVVAAIDDRYETAALFAHNPGITEFASSLTSIRINDMPTCGIFAVACNVLHWSGFMEAEKVFLFFEYPKMAGL